MWKIKFKPNNDSQPWTTLETYKQKSQALLNAAKVSAEYFRVNVIDIDGNTVWSNYG